MLWSHFGSSHRIYSNRFFVCQLIWLENWSPALLQGHYGGSFYDMGLIFQFCWENLSKQKKERKIKRLHVLFKFIYHRKLYTPIDVYFPLDYSGFPFLKYCYQKMFVAAFMAFCFESFVLQSNEKGWSFPILWCMRIYKNILKAGRILFGLWYVLPWILDWFSWTVILPPFMKVCTF